MAKSENEKLLDKELEKYMKNDATIAQLEERIAKLKARKSDAEKKAKEKIRRDRTHRLCTIGADVEKIFGRPLEVNSNEYKEFLDAVKQYVTVSVEKPFYYSFEDEDE